MGKQPCNNAKPRRAKAFNRGKEKGAKAFARPVQELRLLSGSSFDLRSQADRFLRTADPQVLISKKK